MFKIFMTLVLLQLTTVVASEGSNLCDKAVRKTKTVRVGSNSILLSSSVDNKGNLAESQSASCIVNNLWHCHKLFHKSGKLSCHNARYGAVKKLDLNLNGTPIESGQKSNAYFTLTQTIKDVHYSKNIQKRTLKYGSCKVKVGISKPDFKKHYSIQLLSTNGEIDLEMSLNKRTCYSNLTVGHQGLSCYTKSVGKMIYPWRKNCDSKAVMAQN